MDDSIFGLSCSLRDDSLNEKLLEGVAERLTRRFDVELRTAKLTEFPMPLYDADIQQRDGIPDGAHRLREAVEAAGRVVLVTPEYNHSIAAPLKNAIDWTSRFRPNPWAGVHLLLMSASPSRIGGLRGLEQTRVPLQALGAHVFPGMYGLAQAPDAFEEGRLVDEGRIAELDDVLEAFLDHVRNCDQGGERDDR